MLVIFLIFFAGCWFWPGLLGAGPAAPLVSPPPPAEIILPYFRAPDKAILCGEPVPLEDPAVKEDLDREFTITVWNRIQTTMWIKRAHRYFPEIERKIRDHRLPADLKYVVLVESDLRPKARSSAGAQGPWQFMAPTAQRFQLRINDAVDDRMEFTASTDAALRYLKNLYRLFHNWPLALAGYNCGEGRVQKEMAAQGVKNYYYLALPEETERYVYRIIAAKIVCESPERYGFLIPPDQLYPPQDCDEVNFTITREVPVKTLAEACGSYYKAIKRLNPWIKGANLTPGTYHLKIPKGAAPRFKEAYSRGQIG
ncbi:MAG: lytic transglycosylase [Deltaproteobacteria bacterium]|nr:MAG: lytic transglycosylase [Deltaproteobacteria bacterium]